MPLLLSGAQTAVPEVLAKLRGREQREHTGLDKAG